MSWLKVELQVAESDVDGVGELLEELGASSTSVLPASGAELPVWEPGPGVTPVWQQCVLAALLPLDTDLSQLRRRLNGYSAEVLGAEFLADQQWQDSWREHAVHRCFAQRLWVLPVDASEVAGPAVRLDPGLAFGTGAHPTTELCLEWLASADLRGQRVLDFGCGSGILAIAAAQLGARQVWAVDHDPQALQATRANAELNGVADQLTVAASLPGGLAGGCDLVVANILARPLLELAAELSGALRPAGKLVLSGLLARQVDMIVAGYPAIEFSPPVTAGDWVCLVGRRHGATQ